MQGLLRHSASIWRGAKRRAAFPTAAITYLSDGLIIDGKLNNIFGNQDISPLLVESNCLEMAIDDTIDFTSLSGWSIVSNNGTAIISIDGNSIKCTSAGTLYNLILSDGTNNHIYSLAEGGYTIAHDTNATPQHGTINCALLTWTTQDEYHKNIEGHNIRTGIDVYRNSNFVDSNSDGIPDGWISGTGCTITTTNGIVRVTKVGDPSYFNIRIALPNSLVLGKDYKALIMSRASSNILMEIRFGGFGGKVNVPVTQEWQTLQSSSITSVGTELAINGGTTKPDWFEFYFLLIEEPVTQYRVPLRDNSIIDAQGNNIDVIGNGYFIDSETKLKFPITSDYQDIDDHMYLLYNRQGNQNSIPYSLLAESVYRFDRVLCVKENGKLTRMAVVNPTNFTRNQFRAFLRSFNLSDYVYKPITNGALIFFDLEQPTLNETFREVINNKGASLIGHLLNCEALEYYPSSQTVLDNWLHNYYYARLNFARANLSFEFLSGEEALYSTEIANGDLEVFDVPGGKRGAVAKVDFPDWNESGIATTVATTKQSGTVILDNTVLNGYSNMILIPAGQSGVPAELEEIPLWTMRQGSIDTVGKLYYYMWPADEFFGVTFTNADSINVRNMEYSRYRDLVSVTGLTCVQKHMIKAAESLEDFILRGFLESAGPPLMGASVSSKATWDSGMLFGSNSQLLSQAKDLIFDNQNNPREWCCYFNHHVIGNGTTLEQALARIEIMAEKNELLSNEWESEVGEWGDRTEENINILINKCDESGTLFLSPFDLIKNMQFNDYDKTDFWK